MKIDCGKKHIDLSKTVVMGILNVTPDSFSDGGSYNGIDQAVHHAERMVLEGADIIDIGGESTRPGAQKVDEQEELNRVIPIISAISKAVNVPISIDTYKSEVARQALDAGASIINDVWGAKADPKIAEVAAEYNVPIILMHNRNDRNYSSLMDDIVTDLADSINVAKKAGVSHDKIMLDPGIGFAKNYEQNLTVMKHLDRIVEMGFPVLLGTSRKSFIGLTLNLPVEERVEGTGATVCLGIAKGCKVIRVHDVLEMKRMVKMMDAMLADA
jgi:dihydropteroate synthase